MSGPKLPIMASRSPSPSRSPRVTDRGESPTAMVVAGRNVPFPSLRRTLTLPEPRFATQESRSPSPSRSPTVTETGWSPTANVGGVEGRNVPFPWFRRTLTLSESKLATQASRSPSPSRSPSVTEYGRLSAAKESAIPAGKSVGPAPWLRRTLTFPEGKPESKLATHASRSPSPSRSPRVTATGVFPTAKVEGVDGRKVPFP